MSVSAKKELCAQKEFRRCTSRFWRLFPHLLLSASLVGYAALGALIFQHIEGKSPGSGSETEYHKFLGDIVSAVQNHSSKSRKYGTNVSIITLSVALLIIDRLLCPPVLSDDDSYTHEDVVRTVQTKMDREFKSIWLQRPARWSFFGSMFFCCTVFTTVGESEVTQHIYGDVKCYRPEILEKGKQTSIKNVNE